jgi:hypothetical protein
MLDVTSYLKGEKERYFEKMTTTFESRFTTLPPAFHGPKAA